MTTILYRMTPLEYNSLLGNLYRGISSGYYTITQLGLEEDDDVSDDEMNILFDNIRFKSFSQP